MYVYRGSCLCRSIKFEIGEFLPRAAHCHCSMCRKFHGAAYATFASVPRAKFRWLQGEDTLKTYKADNGTQRGFCSHCGSSLTFYSPRAPEDVIEVALAAIDGEVPIQPDAHIFVGSGAAWAKPCDGLPMFEAGRNSKRIE